MTRSAHSCFVASLLRRFLSIALPIFAILAMASPANLFAIGTTYIWNTNSGNWTNSGLNYWSNASLPPTSNSTAIIDNGGTAILTNGGNALLLTVGSTNAGNTLVVSNGGTLNISSDLVIGTNGTSSNNSVIISGSGSQIVTVGTVSLGASGSGNRLIVSNGGLMSTLTNYVGVPNNPGATNLGTNNAIIVTGSGSRLSNSYFNINGTNNSLTVTNGGTVITTNLLSLQGTLNAITVTDSNSVLNAASSMIGTSSGGSNKLLISNFATANITGALMVARAGGSVSNTVVVTGGGTLTAGSMAVGGTLNSNQTTSFGNSVVIAGSNSTLISSNDFVLGVYSGTNSLVISNGGRLVSGAAFIGSNSVNNSVLITGAGSRWTNSGKLTIGESGSGSVTVASGGTLVSSNITIANQTNSVGVLNIGTFGGNDTNVTLNVGTILFGNIGGGGKGSLNFNQANRLNLTSSITGGTYYTNTTIAQLGSGTTVLTGISSNLYSKVIVNGGKFIVDGGTLDGSNSSPLIVGLQSSWSNYPYAQGYSNSTPVSMLITNDGKVSLLNVTIGWGSDSVGNALNNSNNSITVSGTNSILTSLYGITVGYGGSSNSLVITNGAGVILKNTSYIGYGLGSNPSGGNFNSVLVTGTNSLYSNSSYTVIGYYGNGNTMTVSNGAKLYGTDDSLGIYGNSNTLIVTGSNTFYSNFGNLYVGFNDETTNGFSNRMIVSNSASVNIANNLYVGYLSYTNGGNSILVTGTNSSLSNGSGMYLGYWENGDTVTVTNGAILIGKDDYIGYGYAPYAGNSNLLIIAGSNSLYSNSGNLVVGYGYDYQQGASNNSLVISDGAKALIISNVIVGQVGGSKNSVIVTGEESALSNGLSLYIGYGSSNSGSVGNSLIVSNGGRVIATDLNLGLWQGDSNNTVIVTDTNSQLSIEQLYIGNRGNNNSVLVSNGGRLSATNGEFEIGMLGTNNKLNIVGTNSVVEMNDALFCINGNASLVVSNGAVMTSFVSRPDIYRSNNQIIITGINSLWSNGGISPSDSAIMLGHYNGDSNNSISILNGGRLLNNSDLNISYGSQNNNNYVLISGAGSLLSNSGTITVGQSGSGSLVLASGATLISRSISVASSNSSVGVVNIGTYGGNDTNLSFGVGTVSFNDGTGTINFNQADTIVIPTAFTGVTNTTNFNIIAQLGTGTTVVTGRQAGTNGLMLIANGGQLVFSNAIYTSARQGDGEQGNVYVGYQNGKQLTRGYPAYSNSTPASMLITSNSSVTAYNVTIGYGYDTNGRENGNASNSLVINGSSLAVSNDLSVGYGGNSNLLILTNGAQVTSGDIYIGEYGNGNKVIVTGSSTTWSNAGSLQVGWNDGSTNGLSNSLIISDGAKIISSDTYVGFDSFTNGKNTLLITGAGSVLTNDSSVYVGYYESGSSLIVTNGGALYGNGDVVGDGGSSNTMTITGSNSLYSNAGELYLGYDGTENKLFVSDKAVAATRSNVYVGYIGSNSTLKVESGASLLVGAVSFVGYEGNSNLLSISGPGSIFSNEGTMFIGYGNVSNNASVGNSFEVTNGATATVYGSELGGIKIGYIGADVSNSLSVSGNSTLTVFGQSDIGVNGSFNTATVSGSNTLWTNSGYIVLGSGAGSSDNRLVISDGGKVYGTSLLVGYGNADQSNNSVLISGPNSTFISANYVDVGYYGSGPNHSLVVSNGGSLISATGIVGEGGGATNNYVTLTGAGSKWSNSGTITIGDAAGGIGTVNIKTGASLISSNIIIANQDGSVGTLNVGTYGGSDTNMSLNAPSITFGTGSGTLNFNQADTIVVSSKFGGFESSTAGLKVIAQLGTGSTVMTGRQTGTNYLTLIANGGSLVFSNAVYSSDYSSGVGSFSGSVYIGYQNDGDTNYYAYLPRYSNSAPASMVITSNSSLTVNNLSIGYGYLGTNYVPSGNASNSLVVNGSVLNLNGRIYVGNGGNFNTLTLTNGATVNLFSSFRQGYSGSGNRTIVTGSNTALLISNSLTVGYSDYTNALNNSLIISDGARVIVSESSEIGVSSYTNGNNSVLVTGSNSTFSNTGGFSIGYYEDADSITVSNGAKLYGSNDSIGTTHEVFENLRGGNSNRVVVTGTNSLYSNAGDLFVGYANNNPQGASNNSLVISNGARSVIDGSTYISYAGGSNNSILITGNSSLSNRGSILVGSSNSIANTLELSDRAAISASNITVAASNTLLGNGTITTVSGVTVAGNFAPTGTNSLTVNGNLSFTGGKYLWNLYNNSTNPAGGTNFTVTSILNNGMLSVSGSSFQVTIGTNVTSGAFWNNDQVWTIMTGTNVGSGTNFSLVFLGNTNVIDQSRFSLKQIGNDFSLVYSLPGTYWRTNTQPWTNGNNWTSLSVPTNTTSAFIDNGGTSVLWTNGVTKNLTIASTNTSSGTLLITNGGVLTVSNALTVGNLGSGTLTLAKGGVLNATNINLASQTGSAGVLNVGTFGGRDTNVTLNVPVVTFGQGSASVNFNQADTLVLPTLFGGAFGTTNFNSIAQLGAGTTVLTGHQVGTNQLTLIANGGVLVLSNAIYNSISQYRYSGRIYVGFQDYQDTLGDATLPLFSNSTPASMLLTSNSSVTASKLWIGYGNAGSNTIVGRNNSNSLLVNKSSLILEKLYVGYGGNSNRLIFSNGASANVSNEFLIGNYGDGNGVTVTGTNSSLNATAGITLGALGSYNSLQLRNGSVLNADSIDVGNNELSNSTYNTILVSGASVTATNGIWLGDGANNNTMIVSNAATVSAGGGYVGDYKTVANDSGNSNRLIISGVGSTYNNSADFSIGDGSSANSLIVSSGGRYLNSGSVFVGDYYGSNNILMVTGDASRFSNTGNLYVGYGAGSSANTLVVSNGGSVLVDGSTIYAGVIGYQANANSNSIIVAGSNSSILDSNYLVIGYTGSGNSLVISNGASVYDSAAIFGAQPGSLGNTALVTGPGSLWSNSSFMVIGEPGSSNNRLSLDDHAVVHVSGSLLVGSNNTLSGNGTIISTNGTLISGNFAPAGTNVLTVNGNLDFSGGTYLWNLFANSTNNPSSGLNYTAKAQLNGLLSVSNASTFTAIFGNGVNALDTNFWGVNHLWPVMTGTNPASIAASTNFALSVNGPLPTLLFGLTNISDTFYLRYVAPLITNVPVPAGQTNYLPDYTNTTVVIHSGGGTTYLGSNNPGLISTIVNEGTLIAPSTNSFPTNGNVTVNGGTLAVQGEGTTTVNVYEQHGGTVASTSNSVVAVGSYLQTGGNLSGGSNATFWAANYLFRATNVASVGVNLDNLGTVLNFHSTAIVTTNANGIPVAPVVFNTDMRYDGGTTITGGILQLGSSNSSGPVTVQGVINNNGYLNYGYNGDSTTPTNLVIGSGVIGQVGTGTLTVGANGVDSQFTGSFASAKGTLQIMTNSALGGATNYYLADSGTLQAAAGVTNISQSVNVTNGTGIINNASGSTLALNGTLTKSGSVLVLAGGTIDVNGLITGSGSPGSFNSDIIIGDTNLGAGTVTLNLSNNYQGPSFVTAGSKLLGGVANALPTNTILTMGAVTDATNRINRYDLNGFDQTLAGLSSAGSAGNLVTNGSVAVKTLTINGATNTTYSGVIAGNIALVRSGTGAITLTHNNTYTGGTTINSGKIVTTANTALGTGIVSLNGGTLEVRSLLTIAAFNWTGGKVALPTLTSLNGIYLNSTNALTLTGASHVFDLNGARLTQGKPTRLLGATNMNEDFTTNQFSVEGVSKYALTISNDILWIDLLGNPVPPMPSAEPSNSIVYPNFVEYAVNRNQSNVARALNTFTNNPNSDQTVVLKSLTALTNNAPQMQQAFNAIMPTFYQQMATIAFNSVNAQNMELAQRLWGVRLAEGGGFSMSGLGDNYAVMQEDPSKGSGKGVLDAKKDILRPGLDNHWGMFVDGNGIFAQANSSNMLPGYNSESGGVTAGLTYKWNENFASGLYAGYQGTYTRSGAAGSGLGVGSSLTDNAVRFGVFGTYGQREGKGFYANALAGGGYNNYQATRIIQYQGINRTANSSPGAGELDTMLGGGYDIQKGNFTFGPTASLQYTYLGANNLNETGAQSLNFNSGGWNSSSMLSSVGAHAAYTWFAKKLAGHEIVVVPQVSLNWQHEFMQNPYAISGNLGGTTPSFSNWSASPIRDFLYTGVGFTVEFAKKWNTSFFYNAAAGNQNLTSQNIFWSAGLKF